MPSAVAAARKLVAVALLTAITCSCYSFEHSEASVMVDAPFNQVGLDQHAHSGDMIKANLCWHSTVCARCGQDQHGIAFRSLGGVSCSAALCRWLMY
eukprot:SAG31_NODE_24864_length_473_cov_0.553476_1_plen_96_part_10